MLTFLTSQQWLVIISSLVIFLPGSTIAQKKELYIGGLFPINGTGGWQGGQACKPAALMALEDINKSPELLPGYTLRLRWEDSECDPRKAASVLRRWLNNNNDPGKVTLLLAGCSKVCKTVAEEAVKRSIIVLCYGASSPALSNREVYSTLFRTHPSATIHNPTRIRLMKKFGWSKVAIVHQAEEVFILTADDLEERCKAANIEVVTRQSFSTDPTEAIGSLKAQQDAKIVVGMFYAPTARKVLCEAWKQDIHDKYVWFLIGWYEGDWYENNLEEEGITCTKEEMKQAAEGHLTTEAVMWNQDKTAKTISGMTNDDFRERLDQALIEDMFDISDGYPEGYQEAPLAYDAVWAVALALDKTISRLADKGKSLEDFANSNINNNREIQDEMYNALETTSFLGISGNTAFDENTDRIILTQVEQMINGEYRLLGYYDAENMNLTWYDKEQWAGGKVPQDGDEDEADSSAASLIISMTVTGAWAIMLILFM